MTIDYGTLRSLLETPSPEAFQRILAHIADAPEGERPDVSLYLEQRLETWPVAYRIPGRQECGRALTSDDPLPWYWPLARALDNGHQSLSTSHLERWAATPELFAPIEHFATDGGLRQLDSIEPLWRDNVWRGLRSLTLNDVILPSSDWTRILQRADFSELEELHVVFSSPMKDEHIKALCRNPSLTRLRTLSLYGNGAEGLGEMGPDGIDALGKATFRDTLTRFELGGYTVYPKSYRPLFALPSIEHLDLRCCDSMRADQLERLPKEAPSLRTLLLSSTSSRCDPSPLIEGSLFDGLEELHVMLDTDLLGVWEKRGPLENLQRLTSKLAPKRDQMATANALRLLEVILPEQSPLTSLELEWWAVHDAADASELGALLDLIAERTSLTALALPMSGWTEAEFEVLVGHDLWTMLDTFVLRNTRQEGAASLTRAALTRSARPRLVLHGQDRVDEATRAKLDAAGFTLTPRHRHDGLSWRTALGRMAR